MQHIKMIQKHPNRDWILVGVGAAALLGLYACYKCCCRRRKVAPKTSTGDESKKSPIAESPRGSDTRKEADIKSEGTGERWSGGKDQPGHRPTADSAKSSDAHKSKVEEVMQLNACKICERYLAPENEGKDAAAEAEKTEKSSKPRDGEKAEGKPYVDCDKYLQKIHPPSNLVCPPARVGISLFMDSRCQSTIPHVSSNANTYKRDRYFRGNSFTMPKVGTAYLHHISRFPLPPTKPMRCARPGKMLRVMAKT
ncbi:hypothetical protein PoB_002607800 [Plakobranchus ocellatus]|uniref:Uncharacterized protein n=1 Tax=Plakobranchus ocellatus TaxID=259542 RepID=A0AAV3ZXI4_9GAST|nr:hypothetical protein PoB_002607800 [Plakobranchus ocellatus]